MTGFADVRLPVTGVFALSFAAYFVFLSARVGVTRIVKRVAIGDRVVVDDSSSSSSSPSPSSSATATATTADASKSAPLKPVTTSGPRIIINDPLLQAARAHANFAENVPLALVLASVAELNGGGGGPLARALAALLVFRVLHAELGLMRRDALGIGRPVGFYGTLAVLGWLRGWSAWLALGGAR
ncbi:membrane-associated, eicosanoid/glutathione metabolism protein [Hypoxylon crocopeplum]|nr:membrane-associated, eicosanoid/glutathione metabolism protein [Hypoxylon crocopeplum]